MMAALIGQTITGCSQHKQGLSQVPWIGVPIIYSLRTWQSLQADSWALNPSAKKQRPQTYIPGVLCNSADIYSHIFSHIVVDLGTGGKW